MIKSDKPTGKIAFVGARIITMEGDEVIENGTILINENEIEAIGTNITIPSNTKIIDVKGKTIMPGIIDAHAHVGGFRAGLTTQKHWQFYANLAYGVTTAHDPSANSETVFTLSEMIKSGEMVSGNIGSASLKRLDYTVIGDTVNTAARLQDAAKENQIVISEDCYEKLKESFKCEKIGSITLKNKANPMTIYQVME